MNKSELRLFLSSLLGLVAIACSGLSDGSRRHDRLIVARDVESDLIMIGTPKNSESKTSKKPLTHYSAETVSKDLIRYFEKNGYKQVSSNGCKIGDHPSPGVRNDEYRSAQCVTCVQKIGQYSTTGAECNRQRGPMARICLGSLPKDNRLIVDWTDTRYEFSADSQPTCAEDLDILTSFLKENETHWRTYKTELEKTYGRENVSWAVTMEQARK